jgi:beta-phosphoglucomutase-like phosphatase (HAD superfamily)
MKGIIFDFNGTLFQDADKHLKAWKLFAKDAFDIALSDVEYAEHLEGWDDRHAILYLAGGDLPEKDIFRLAEEKEAAYRKLCFEDKKNLILTRGAEDLFDFIAELGIPRNIATASCKSNVDFYVKEFNLERWFTVSRIVYDDGTIPGKPAPDYYLRAANAIEVPAVDCIVVEDSVPGVRSAHKAGIGKIIAIASMDKQNVFKNMEEVGGIINDFNEFDRRLLIN